MFVAMSTRNLLSRTRELATSYLDNLGDRRVGSLADYETLIDTMGGPLPDRPSDALAVIERLAATADPGLVATAGPRHFGFVIGGAVPAALAADWLTAAWDQNAFSFVLSPAAVVVEEISRRWLTELLGLSPDTSMGIVTGATMATFTSLAAARHALLLRLGWNAEEQGLFGAPPHAGITNHE
jgi:glutamate/tyrosine decarboxylase-like PLP-dependent enzyme